MQELLKYLCSEEMGYGREVMSFLEQLDDGCYWNFYDMTLDSFNEIITIEEIIKDWVDVLPLPVSKKLHDYNNENFVVINTETEEEVMFFDTLLDVYTYIIEDNYPLITKKDNDEAFKWVVKEIPLINEFYTILVKKILGDIDDISN